MSKKKHRKRLHFLRNQPNRQLDTREQSPVVCIAPTAVSARSTLKVEDKDSQLPVTDSALEIRPGFIKLFSPLDTKSNQHTFLWWIPDHEAHAHLRKREVVQLHFTRRRILSVHLVEKAPPAGSPVSASPDPGKKPASMRRKSVGDSHNKERDDNPAGVWTIDSLPSTRRTAGVFVAKIFDRVLTDLLYGPEYLKRAA